MPEIPDFSHYERNDEPLRGFTEDDMIFLADLGTQADLLFDPVDQSTTDELNLCRQAYGSAIEQRTEIIANYLGAVDSSGFAAYIKAGEAQLYTLFCEYIDVLLHAPSEYGPHIATEIIAALTLADTSQTMINERTGGPQFANDKLQQAIIQLIMAAHGGSETQHVLQELYKKHIYDVVMRFVDNESRR